MPILRLANMIVIFAKAGRPRNDEGHDYMAN